MNAHVAYAFEIYVDDDRYAVPTLHLVTAVDDGHALDIAARLMRECPHHRGAELCRGGERLAGLGTFATRRTTEDARNRVIRPR